MKKMLSDAQLEETRNCASPVQNITRFNLSLGSGTSKYVIS